MTFSGNRDRWDAFDWSRHAALDAAKRTIVDWYNALPDAGALVLAGTHGAGKSHIARAIYELFGAWRASFYEEITLCKAIQSTYDDRSLSEDGFIRQALFRPELFVLDDLGTYSTSNPAWIQNIYHRIFNDYLTIQERPILITTNLPLMSKSAPSVQDRIGSRSFSRLCGAMGGREAYVRLFDVPDYRIEGFLNADR